MTDGIESRNWSFFWAPIWETRQGSPPLPQSWRFQSHKDAPATRSGARVSNGKARSGRILDRSTARTRNTARAGIVMVAMSHLSQ